jgi:hypothetical protein
MVLILSFITASIPEEVVDQPKYSKKMILYFRNFIC